MLPRELRKVQLLEWPVGDPMYSADRIFSGFKSQVDLVRDSLYN